MNIPRDVKPSAPAAANGDYDADAVLDLRSIFWGLIKWSWIIVVLAAYGFYGGYKEARNFTPEYVASMIVEPHSQGGGVIVGGGAGGRAAAGGLAAGLTAALGVGSGGGQGTGAFDRLKLLMSSIELAKRLDDRYGMLREVYADRWDAEKQEWKQRVDPEPTLRNRIMASLHQTGSLEPGYEALSRYVNGVVQFEQIELTGFWRVKVQHQDRDRALELLQRIYNEADDLLRQQDRRKLRRKMEYLETRIQETAITDLRRALLASLVKEEHSAHLLSGNLPYGADIVEPAFVSGIKSRPNLVKTIGIPTVGGAAVGFFLALLIAVFRAESGSRKRKS